MRMPLPVPRWIFLLLLVAVQPVVGSWCADANEVRIGVLVSAEGAPYQDALAGFRSHLEQRGIRAVYSVHALRNDPARARTAAQKEKGQGARMLLALGTLAVQAAGREAPDLPVVAGLVLNAGELKAAPNATGVLLELPLETELRWLQRMLPRQKHVGVLYTPGQNQARVNEAMRLAKSLGLELHARQVNAPRELPEAMEGLANSAEVLWGLSDAVALNPQTAQSLLLFSFRNRIPFVGLSRSWVNAGALYALERDYHDIGRQCGELAHQLLQGTPASAVPPEVPRTLIYSVNLRTARHMKVEFPEALLKGAQAVVD
jgi:putative ABC transport system substrate-binding protein